MTHTGQGYVISYDRCLLLHNFQHFYFYLRNQTTPTIASAKPRAAVYDYSSQAHITHICRQTAPDRIPLFVRRLVSAPQFRYTAVKLTEITDNVSMANENPVSQNVSFTDLPSEIRNQIYEDYLATVDKTTVHFCKGDLLPPSLARTSSQVRKELMS